MDLFGDPTKRDGISPFIRLLWERGSAHEYQVIDELTIPVLDLSDYAGDVKEQHTREAMERREPLIYSGRIHADDLLGEPDLLRLEDDGYVAGDIKSGSGEEGGEDDPRPDIFRMAKDQNWVLWELRESELKLQDVFQALTQDTSSATSDDSQISSEVDEG